MNFDELSPEMHKKARECKTPEEVLSLAREQGFELSDEQLQAVSAGAKWRCEGETCSSFTPCPLD